MHQEEVVVILSHEEKISLECFLFGTKQDKNEAEETALSAMSVFNSTNKNTEQRSVKSVAIVPFPYSTLKSTSIESDTAAYIINFTNEEGFAVVSADRRTETKLALAEKGNLDFSDTTADYPLIFDELFSNIAMSLEKQKAETEERNEQILENVLNKFNITRQQTSLKSAQSTNGTIVKMYHDKIEDNSVKPLLTTHWHRKNPFSNNLPLYEGYYPVDASSEAIATAQVMAYHKFPKHYNWDLLLQPIEKYSKAAENEAAKLTADLCNGITTEYSRGLTISEFDKIAPYLIKIGYNQNAQCSPFNVESVVSSLDNQLPVIVSGNYLKITETTGSWIFKRTKTYYGGQHSWVIDGKNDT